jgi:hypothetical protein
MYAGDDPDGYALAVNGQRRDLGKGRKAMVAAQSLLVTNSSTADAARAIGVSQSLVAKAVTVRDHAADLVPEVLAGAMGLEEAYKAARQRKAPANPEIDRGDWLRREFAAERPREVSAANALIARLERGEALIRDAERECVMMLQSASHLGYWWVALLTINSHDDGGALISTDRPMLAVGVPWFLTENGVSVRLGTWEPWNMPSTDRPFWLGGGS